MIAATAGQLADLLEVNRREGFRVRIADNSDTLQDVTSHVLSLPDITIDVNANARTATVELQRETEDGSLSPLMSGTPAIYPRRRIVIDLAIKRYDESIGGDWLELFNGFIDSPQFGGREARMTLPCRDHWRVLYDTYIEPDTEAVYGSSSGEPIAEVMQDLIDDTLGPGVYTIDVIGTPTTTIKEYTQRPMRLSDALIDLANVNGWHLRFVGTTLRFEEPPRSKTTPDYTFTTNQYFDVPTLELDPNSIVNRCLVKYTDTDVTVSVDSASVALWGKMVGYIDASQQPQFDNSTAAQALGDVVVADRANPITLMTVKGRLFPYADIWDLYRWTADGILYEDDLDLAVSKVIHSFPPANPDTPPTTTLHLQGSPSGGVDRWERLLLKTEAAQEVADVTGIPVPSPQATVSARFDSSGNLSAVVDGSNLAIQSWKVLGSLEDQPTKEEVEGATPIDGPALTPAEIGNLATSAEAGDIGHVAAIAYSGAGGAGAATAVFRDLATFGTPEAGIPEDSVGTPQLKDHSVLAQKIKRQSMMFTTNVQFISSAYNHIRWLPGSIDFQDGTSQTIDAGDVSPLSATRYIYFNGTSTLQVTSSYDTVLGNEDYILMCVARAASSEQGGCTFIPAFGGFGASTLSIATSQIVANAIKAAQADIIALSALSADLGTIVSGYLQNNSGTTYIDLDAVDNDIFIACGTDLILRANGAAYFGGEVTANALVASTNLIAAEVSIQALRFGTHAGSGLWNYNGARIDASSGGSGRLTLSNSVVVGSASGLVGFFGDPGSTKTTITGAVSGEATLTQLLTDLHNKGLITWSGI